MRRRIERHIAREVTKPVLGTLVVLLAVVVAYYAAEYLGQAAAEQLPARVVLLLTGLRIGVFLDVMLSAALFLGIVLGLGRLQADYEITALAAAGGSRGHVLRALILPMLLVAVAVLVAAVWFRPFAYATIYEVESRLAVRVDLSRVEPGRFHAGDEEFMIFAEGRRGRVLEDVTVHQGAEEQVHLIRARYLHQETTDEDTFRLVFTGGVSSYRLGGTGADLQGQFSTMAIRFEPPAPPTREEMRRALPAAELVRLGGPVEMAEFQWRAIAPLSVFLLALTGVSLSRINPRRGQSARVLTASLVMVLYFTVLGVGINWTESALVPVWLGAWWVPGILALILAIRFWRTRSGPGAPL